MKLCGFEVGLDQPLFQTPVKVYINGHDLPQAEGFKMFGTEDSKICIGDLDVIRAYLEENKDKITETYGTGSS